MDTNIHLYVERKEGGNWVPADTWETNRYDANTVVVPYERRYYDEPNSDLFAILGDDEVDNRGFVPIARPRDLPDDVSNRVREALESTNENGRNFSWLTLAELLAYDWTQTITVRGWLGAIEYFRWNDHAREHGEGPRDYFEDVSGAGVKHLTEPEMQKFITDAIEGAPDCWPLQEDAIRARLAGHHCPDEWQLPYCRCEWQLPYYKCARRFLSDTLPRLWRLGRPEEVRIVFCFVG